LILNLLPIDKNMLKQTGLVLICLGLALSLPAHGLTQTPQERREYVIGNGDLLSITFWQRPELNTEARVTASGTIEMPLIGAIQAAGLTPAKLRDNIVSRVSLLDIRITQAAVIVREYASKTVYVTGAVLSPGKKSFEAIPNLWQIILEAGGPQPMALLNDVTIIRSGGEETGRTIHADLAEALERGDFSSLPPVYPGDYINVPSAAPSEVGTGSVSTGALISASGDMVHVFGQVARPGSFNLDKQMDLFDALILAGGPTDLANLKDVRLYFRGRRQAEMASIDMEHYMNRSTPLPLMLHPGDAIYVTRKKAAPPFVFEAIRVVVTSLSGYLIFSILR
jgi:polysaccharide export outer membrane protein